MSAAPAPVRIRAARPYDAAALLELKHQLDRETSFMMYEPGERDSPVRDLAAELAGLARRSECLLVDGQFIDELTMATLLPVPLPLHASHRALTRTKADIVRSRIFDGCAMMFTAR